MRDKRRKAGRRTVAAVAFFYVNALAVVYLYVTCVYLQLTALQSNRASSTSTSTSFDRHPQSSNTTAASYSYRGNDVFRFDHLVLENIVATYEGASSHIRYDGSALPPEVAMQAAPLMASVDRRPIVVRKQLLDDREAELARGGALLGCAMTATTFVTNLLQLDVSAANLKRHGDQHTCQLCFQFSNRHDVAHFLPETGDTANLAIVTQPDAHTKCVAGAASIHALFAQWQQQEESKGERFQGFGYPWTVDCMLPNGIKQLTCREISRMQNNSRGNHTRLNDVNVHLETGLVLSTKNQRPKAQATTITVTSKWPWSALTSHDDDRSTIADKLSFTWTDENSWSVPKHAQEMKLAHVEGPGWSDSSRGGVHARLLVNLYHFIRHSPGSTHIIGE
jgi:hypothetical protein